MLVVELLGSSVRGFAHKERWEKLFECRVHELTETLKGYADDFSEEEVYVASGLPYSCVISRWYPYPVFRLKKVAYMEIEKLLPDVGSMDIKFHCGLVPSAGGTLFMVGQLHESSSGILEKLEGILGGFSLYPRSSLLAESVAKAFLGDEIVFALEVLDNVASFSLVKKGEIFWVGDVTFKGDCLSAFVKVVEKKLFELWDESLDTVLYVSADQQGFWEEKLVAESKLSDLGDLKLVNRLGYSELDLAAVGFLGALTS